MQKQDKQRTKKMSREQQLKVKKDMELPVNKFLNAQTKDGKIKYPIAEKLRKYFISNPDPILNDMRLSNALLHEIRWHKKQSEKYLGEHGAAVIKMKDKEGRFLERDDCYLAYISERQNIHIALSRLREHLSSKLLSKCDGDFFTFEQYNEFVLKCEAILAKEGYELLPSEVTLIEPL